MALVEQAIPHQNMGPEEGLAHVVVVVALAGLVVHTQVEEVREELDRTAGGTSVLEDPLWPSLEQVPDHTRVAVVLVEEAPVHIVAVVAALEDFFLAWIEQVVDYKQQVEAVHPFVVVQVADHKQQVEADHPFVVEQVVDHKLQVEAVHPFVDDQEAA